MSRLSSLVALMLMASTSAFGQTSINGIPAQAIPIPAQKSWILNNPTAGFTATIPDGITIAVIKPAAALAIGTLTLPANPADGMPLTIESTKAITALSLLPNTGQTLSATITIAATLTPIRLKFSAGDATWYPN
jgi:hypothetical protein